MRRAALALLLCSVASYGAADVAGRIDVVDGDTLRISGETVRLFGIDAPELAQECEAENGAVWACGRWARAQMRDAFQGRFARCVEEGRDRYGRSVARCDVAGVDLGRWLVERGVAFAYRRYSMAYDLAEKGAVVTGRGLHKSRVQPPEAFRAAGALPAQVAPDSRCQIKGNISSGGARIYHVQGQEHYGRTRISAHKGERWFCSEAEAIAAGWRRARR
ncbi:MAG: thermonuclease family protein [Roseobacter sp.]|nr:thermonuclease family protein [uncultured Lentibacter sp.]MCW1954706.1 thermonuclease family protein [Roseobacter sp.]